MGQHTWFAKDRQLYEEMTEMYQKLNDFEDGLNDLDDYEISKLESKIESIYDSINTDYHDLFRTNKRDSDGEYISDTITSREDCFEWINNPDNLVSFRNTIFDSDEQEMINREKSIEKLNEFWDKYPNGLIYFG
jgi:hypothetical protein